MNKQKLNCFATVNIMRMNIKGVKLYRRVRFKNQRKREIVLNVQPNDQIVHEGFQECISKG